MKKNIAIVGATGVVGQEVIRCLFELKFPLGRLRLLASERSAGKKAETPFGEIEIEAVREEIFGEVDMAIFAVGSEMSKGLLPFARQRGCLVIDNSSAFRYDDEVPLVVPQINAEAARKHKGVIANPNCTTAIAAVALWPLYREFGLKKVIMATYQAASGAGKEAMDELVVQTKEYLAGKEPTVERFQHPLAFNIIPHIDTFQENGYTKEEMKVAWETRKIFGDDSIAISCTAVRIPTMRAHSEAIAVETRKSVSAEAAREILQHAPGVEVRDNLEKNDYPLPSRASEKFDVEVGRIRQSLVFGDHGLEFFVSGDQLLRGAALNAVEIAFLFV